ncbi:S8 family serine peptidase [Amycolatopsis thailandensis]|uniref:S8 family peptidase n=1 Tax=Amycolatopsis thailandensis TaxID=589330 RepID=UPI003652B467
MTRTRLCLGTRTAAALAAAVAVATLSAQGSSATPLSGTQVADSVRAYLVLTGPGNTDAVAKAVAANGGKVQNTFAQIGVVLAHSGADDFAAKMRKVTGVHKVGDTRGGYDVPPEGTRSARTEQNSTARRYLEPQLGSAITAPAEPVDWNMQQMGADKAWAINPGSRTVTVGILDTGVQGTHEDLRDNFDAANSVSCLYGKTNTTPGAWEPDPGAPAAGHGTSVAGIVAAAKNGKGVVGVAPNVRIAAVKVMEPSGNMFPENVVCGLLWSAEHGFKVTNNSYYVDPVMFNSPDDPDQAAVIEGVQRAVDYARGKGSVTVAAAGNYSTDLDTQAGLFLPGDLPNAISVTADTVDKKLASYSNYGLDSVELTAPGGEGSAMINTTALGGGYTTFNGTSASSPHAAGVVALLASAHPQATPDQLRTMLLTQAIDTPCPAGDSRCTGTTARNSHFGEGIANALAAVSNGGPGPGPDPETPVYTSDFEDPAAWTINPGGTDTATSGRYEVAAPSATSYNALTMQRGDATSGTRTLVTGAAAGAAVGDNDLDGGVTSALSGPVQLPATGTLSLKLSWYLGYLSNSAGADYLRVRAITSDGATVLLDKKSGSTDTAAQWSTATADLTALAGKTIRISVEAADAAGGSLIEAGVDDIRITRR